MSTVSLGRGVRQAYSVVQVHGTHGVIVAPFQIGCLLMEALDVLRHRGFSFTRLHIGIH